MAKKKKQQTVVSNVNPIAELTFNEDPLFAVAAHPTRPLILCGLATGHVYMTKYNDSVLENNLAKKLARMEDEDVSGSSKKLWSVQDFDAVSNTDGLFETVWKTKRHKLSCRVALMDVLSQGESIYTIGKDNVIKKAFTETGKVDFKKKITNDGSVNEEESGILSCAILSPTHSHLVAGDESGNIKVFDIRNKFQKIFEVPKAHDDMVNQIIPIPNGSAYQYISVGSTTVAKIDIRKGVLLQSENQEDEVLSGVFANPGSGEKLLCGMGLGVVTQWKESKNEYQDQLSRVKISKDNSIDCLISTMNDEEPETCWAGCSDGILYKIDGKKASIVETRIHDELDEINMLDIDYDYRLISSGMSSLKIWSNKIPLDVFADNEDNDKKSDEEKDSFGSDSSDWDDLSENDVSDSEGEDGSAANVDEEADEAEEESKETRKRKIALEDAKKPAKKNKQLYDGDNTEQRKVTVKQPKKLLRTVKGNHENGIKKFDDL